MIIYESLVDFFLISYKLKLGSVVLLPNVYLLSLRFESEIVTHSEEKSVSCWLFYWSLEGNTNIGPFKHFFSYSLPGHVVDVIVSSVKKNS